MRAASSFFVEECMLFLVRGKHNIKACLDKKYQNSNAFIVICIHMKYWSVRETKDFFFFLQDSFCGQTTFPLKGCRGFYPRAKRLWWESDMPFTFQFTFTFTFRGYDCLSARNHSLSWNIIPLLFSMSCDQVHSHFRSTFSTQYSTVLLISVSMFLSFIKATQ